MAQRILSSLTRISDLAEVPFFHEPLPRDAWADGDYVLCEVVGKPGPNYRVELVSGRICEVLEGDLVVGAFGKRAATLEGVGDWELIGDDLALHALTPAGLLGKATSVSPLLADLMPLAYKGHLLRDGKLTMPGFVGEIATVPFDLPVVLLIGTSMSAGKTTSGRLIVHELKRKGLKVAAAKLTGAARYRDVLSFGDAGADHLFDFVDVGLPSTVCSEERFAEALSRLLSLIAATGADVLVAEAGASPLEPYNGATAMAMLDENIEMLVLSASDPYAVMGVQHAFARAPDLVSGPCANTDAGIELVRKLCDLPALNLLRPTSLPALRAILNEKLSLDG